MTSGSSGAPREPTRPPAVPTGAIWDAGRHEWLAGQKDPAGWQGLVTGYDAAGLVRSRQHFDAGVAEGPFVRLHPSGAEAYRATFVEGKLHGDTRALSSREPGALPLRSCCVPPGAWALVTRYDHGTWVDQWFEDEAGCPLLADGSRRPERPPTLPEAAQYDENTPGWVLGQLDDLRREGEWRRWSPAGDLLEVASYHLGKLHGVARTYRGGKLTREREYVNGILNGGALEEEIAPGNLADERVRAWRGSFSEGHATGRWTYSDGSGSVLFERDHGVPCRQVELTHPVFAAVAPDAGWLGLAQSLSARGEQGLALCATLRAALAAGDAQGLRKQLLAMTVALGSAESARRSAELRKSRDPAACVQALLEGVAPALVLGHLAALLLGAPRAALDFIDAAQALDPSASSFVATRTLLWFELGQPDQANEEAARLAAAQPQQAAWVAATARLVFPAFEFWPAKAVFELDPNPELPPAVSQPLAQVQLAIVKSATRLAQVRRALVRAVAAAGGAALSEPPWLPPELSALVSEPPPALERYEFVEGPGGDEEDAAMEQGPAVQQGAGEADSELIKVDETLETDGRGITGLMRLARTEWTCLCWLCWGAGLESVALPAELRPPSAFPRALSAAFFQVFRVQDSLQTRGLRSKARGLPAAYWEGLNVDALEPLLAEMAFREAREARAVLYWLGDEECRSLWQDDLRDI